MKKCTRCTVTVKKSLTHKQQRIRCNSIGCAVVYYFDCCLLSLFSFDPSMTVSFALDRGRMRFFICGVRAAFSFAPVREDTFTLLFLFGPNRYMRKTLAMMATGMRLETGSRVKLVTIPIPTNKAIRTNSHLGSLTTVINPFTHAWSCFR